MRLPTTARSSAGGKTAWSTAAIGWNGSTFRNLAGETYETSLCLGGGPSRPRTRSEWTAEDVLLSSTDFVPRWLECCANAPRFDSRDGLLNSVYCRQRSTEFIVGDQTTTTACPPSARKSGPSTDPFPGK